MKDSFVLFRISFTRTQYGHIVAPAIMKKKTFKYDLTVNGGKNGGNRGPSGESGGTHETKKPVTPSEQGGNGSDRNQGEHCKVCKGHPAIPKCSVFLSIGVG